jgi:3-dehydrosphinganine reductase
MTEVAGTHALVTGGSSGIGLALAKLLAERGARLTLVARDPERLAGAAERISEQAGADVSTAPVDVRDRAALTGAVAGAVRAQGPVDLVVTAAGDAVPGNFERLDDEVFRDQMEVDYFGTLHTLRAVVPSMITRRRGHVVTIASTAALVGVFGYSAYAPAKYAVRGLTETLRSELAPHGIVVACAYPPDTDTPGLVREAAQRPEETARISAAIRPRSAEAVAGAIVRGIERDRVVITADVQTAVLARAAGVLAPYVRWSTDRAVRRVQRGGGTVGS